MYRDGSGDHHSILFCFLFLFFIGSLFLFYFSLKMVYTVFLGHK